MLEPGGTVRGDGWRVRCISLSCARVCALHVRALRVAIERERADAVAAFLRRKTMRNGGSIARRPGSTPTERDRTPRAIAAALGRDRPTNSQF